MLSQSRIDSVGYTNGRPDARWKKGSDLRQPRAVVAMKPRRYDIVRRENHREIRWIEDTSDLERAKCRIKELASFWPGAFEVMDQQTHQMLAKVGAPPDEPRKL